MRARALLWPRPRPPALTAAFLLLAAFIVTGAASYDYDYYDVRYGVGKYIVREMMVVERRVEACLRALPRRFPRDPAPGDCRFDAIERLYHGAYQQDLIQPLSECVRAIADPPHPPEVVSATIQCLEDSLTQPVVVNHN